MVFGLGHVLSGQWVWSKPGLPGEGMDSPAPRPGEGGADSVPGETGALFLSFFGAGRWLARIGWNSALSATAAALPFRASA